VKAEADIAVGFHCVNRMCTEVPGGNTEICRNCPGKETRFDLLVIPKSLCTFSSPQVCWLLHSGWGYLGGTGEGKPARTCLGPSSNCGPCQAEMARCILKAVVSVWKNHHS